MTVRSAFILAALLIPGSAMSAEFTLEEFRRLHPDAQSRPGEARIFELHKRSLVLRRYDKNADGVLDNTEVAALERRSAIVLSKGPSPAAASASDPKLRARVAENVVKDDPAQRTTFKTFLRHDFKNVWLFENPEATFEDSGAQLDFLSDRVAHDAKWSLHGVAAAFIQYENGAPLVGGPRVLGFALAPYVLADRLENSNPDLKKKNVRTAAFGGSGEIGIQNFMSGDHYIRVRGQGLSDDISDVRTGSALAEWFPVYPSLNIGIARRILGTPILYRFDPELMLRYDQAVGNENHLDFVTRDHAARLGPVLRATFKLVESEVPDLFDRLVGNFTYHWSQDLYSGRRFTWLEPSLTYNLNGDGNFAITTSYRRGNDEETGARVRQYRLGLTAKW